MKKGLIAVVHVLTAVNFKSRSNDGKLYVNIIFLTLHCPISVQNPPPNPAEKVGHSVPQRSSICEQSVIILDIYPDLRLMCLTEYCLLLR